MAYHWCVLGLGSSHGDDRAGWQLIDRLRSRPDLPAQAAAIGQPVQLLDYLDGCSRLMLVDACSSGAPPGTLTRLLWPDERIGARHRRSSTHDLGLGDVLALAGAMRKLPRVVIVWGIEMETCRPGGELALPVQHALAKLEQAIVCELNPRVTEPAVRFGNRGRT